MRQDPFAMNSPVHQVPRSAGCPPERIREAIDLALSTAPEKPIRAVVGWLWIDVYDVGAEDTLVEEPTFSVLHARKVIFDNSINSFIGGYVYTSVLVKFHDDYIFETKNTSYLLIGSGERLVLRDDELVSRKLWQ